MGFINKQDTDGNKPLLAKGEFGFDDYTAGGDVGRVWIGLGSSNKKLAFISDLPTLTPYDDHLNDTNNPHNVTKAQVGLGNVDNTSDSDKPISNDTQTALNGKSNTNHNHDADYEPKNNNIQSHISSTANPHNVTKVQVGLGNVDNTSDANKPISNATQTALNGKSDINHTHTTEVIFASGEGVGAITYGNSYTLVPLGTVHQTASFATVDVSGNEGEININEDCKIRIDYSYSAEGTSNTRSSGKTALALNGSAVEGSWRYTYHRNTNDGSDSSTMSAILDVVDGDTLALYAIRTHGNNLSSVQDGISVVITKLP